MYKLFIKNSDAGAVHVHAALYLHYFKLNTFGLHFLLKVSLKATLKINRREIRTYAFRVLKRKAKP